jgi:predicted PurR-regulated permease PerM
MKEWRRIVRQNEEKSTNNWTQTWFWKRIVDNKVVSVLVVCLLIILNIYMLSRISHVFQPVQIVLSIVGPPIVFSTIFFYLLKPIVDWLEQKKFSRVSAIAMIFVIVTIGLIGMMNSIVPVIRDQAESFIESWPMYWNNLMLQLDALLNTEAFTDFMDQLRETNIIDNLTQQTSNVMSLTVGGIGSIIGTVTQVVITFITTPFILYYLLKDGERLAPFLLKYVPVAARPRTQQVFTKIHKQVSFYVRGQLIVAAAVGVIFWIGYTIIGLDFGLTLAIIAGFLNMIPYLGSFVAAIPAIIIAVVDSPFMLAQLMIVFAVEQVLENRIIQPQIIGNTLKIHPVVIIFILLVSGRLFGVMGIILGIPGYAVLKIIISMLFEWYQEYSGLYEGEGSPINTSEALVKVREEDE